MTALDKKFAALAAEHAPGQEVRQDLSGLDAVMKGEPLNGTPVDFSHGDVDAHPPTPGSAEAWQSGFEVGGQQAYTEYRGAAAIREKVAARLAEFTGHPLDADSELIITPGTQGALFLALAPPSPMAPRSPSSSLTILPTVSSWCSLGAKWCRSP